MSSIGRIFRVTTYGESHGKGVGCIIDGFPSGVPIDLHKVQEYLNRRKPGQSGITTSRNEADLLEVFSGIQNGLSLGTPIGIFIKNQDVRPGDYSQLRDTPRPGHADFTYKQKYKVSSDSGGGRASARETAARVASGALAIQYLSSLGLRIVAWVDSVHSISTHSIHVESLHCEDIDSLGTLELHEDNDKNPYFMSKSGQCYNWQGGLVTTTPELFYKETITTRCPEPETACKMAAAILNAKAQGDSLGGTIRCVCLNVPPGLGEPCFDKLQALLAHAMFSIPAVKGFEIGSGFAGTQQTGSCHNDMFTVTDSGVRPLTNNAGGVLGGISSGSPLDFRVAFKPPSTISRPQSTVKYSGEPTVLEITGRHDPCVLPRAVPIVESMAALVLLDCYLLQSFRAN